MKGEIINCSTHKDIYFLEANNKAENTNFSNLFAPPAGREMFKYKPRSKLKQKFNPALEFQWGENGAVIDGYKFSIDNRKNRQISLLITFGGGFFAKYKDYESLFMENKSTNSSINNGTQKSTTGNDSKSSTSNLTSTTTTTTTTMNCRSRRSSIDLYEEAAAILGLTCSQTDDCKCIECQCHYFDFEDDIEYSSTATTTEYVVDHNSSCTIQ